MNQKAHWENVYSSKDVDQVSWYQTVSARSLQYIKQVKLPLDGAIIDIGSGASALIQNLISEHYSNITVLDLAESALAKAKAQLGEAGARIEWLVADITEVKLSANAYLLWHDRAVFHFLVEQSDRQAYLKNLTRSVKKGGHVIISTFAEDGPEKCSGLPVARYSAAQLAATLGNQFELLSSSYEDHTTPFNTQQRFLYGLFKKR